MMRFFKFCKIKLAKISALSLIILKVISSDRVDFEVSKLLISLTITSWVTFRKENTLLFIFSFILRMLGWALYFLIAFTTGSNTPFVSTGNCLSLSVLKKCFLYSQKTYYGITDLFYIILPPSLNISLLVPSILFGKFGLTTLQKFLLSVMWLTFKEP